MDKRKPPGSEPPARRGSLVRPYTLTAGRTKASVEIPLEASVQTLQSAMFHRWPLNDVRGRIVQLCVKSPSVAEISARLDLPLGVTRLLVGDLGTWGYFRGNRTLTERSTRDERRKLIGRTLRGLRAL